MIRAALNDNPFSLDRSLSNFFTESGSDVGGDSLLVVGRHQPHYCPRSTSHAPTLRLACCHPCLLQSRPASLPSAHAFNALLREGGSSNSGHFDHLACSHIRTSLPSRLSLRLDSMLSLLGRLKLHAGFLNTGCRGRYLKGLIMLVHMVDTSTCSNVSEGSITSNVLLDAVAQRRATSTRPYSCFARAKPLTIGAFMLQARLVPLAHQHF